MPEHALVLQTLHARLAQHLLQLLHVGLITVDVAVVHLAPVQLGIKDVDVAELRDVGHVFCVV